jgi:hypothetical protein
MKRMLPAILGIMALFCFHLISQDSAAGNKIPAGLASAAMQHIEKLAGMGCREAGSPKETLALAYIEAEFKKMGLLTSREDFDFFSYSPGEMRLRVGTEQLTPESVCFDPYTAATTFSGIATCVIPQLPKEEMSKLDLADKIVITTKSANNFQLTLKKPKAIVFLRADDFDRCLIIANSSAELRTCGKIIKMKSANLVAAIPASSQPGRRILVSAHYDSANGPGASDNASGIALLLEIARYFKQKPAQPSWQLEFAALGAEELGMLGSKAFLAHHAETLDQYELVFNIDTVGGNEGIHIEMLAGIDGASSHPGVSQIPAGLADKADHNSSKRWTWLKPELDTMASCVPIWLQNEIKTAATELDYAFKPSRYMGSDHLIFAQAGIPATDICVSDSYNIMHSPGDTADKISLPSLEKVAALVIRVIEKTMTERTTKN